MALSPHPLHTEHLQALLSQDGAHLHSRNVPISMASTLPCVGALPWLLAKLVGALRECRAHSAHAVRTQCKVLYVGKHSNPSFGPLGEHLTQHARGACAVPRAIRGVANLAPNTKLGEVQ